MAEKEILYNDKGKRICGATKSNRSGICQCTILYANGRCKKHGGPTPNGFSLSQTKTGRHSKYLPVRLAAKFEDAQVDPTLYDLRSEVALIDVRIGELLERVENRDSAEVWKQLSGAYQDVREAVLISGDAKKVLATMGVLEGLINKGLGDWATWREISGMVEQRRKLVESERTHQKQMQMMIGIDQMMLAIGAIMSSVKDYKDRVLDQQALSEISRKIDAYLGAAR